MEKRIHARVICLIIAFIGTISMTGIFFLSSPAGAVGSKNLKVGVLRHCPPFSFVDEKAEILRGFSVDLAKLLAGNMGAGVEFYAMDESRLLNALDKGKINLISGIMIRPGSIHGVNLIEVPIYVERKYFVNRECLTVTCYKDLPGHTVALEKGRRLAKLVPILENISFLTADSQEEALSMVNSGTAQVYISNCRLCSLYFIQKAGLENIKEVGMPIETVPLALAVPTNNPELLTSLSVAFGKILENKTFDVIYRKWLGQNVQYSAWNKYVKFIMGGIGIGAFVLAASIFWSLTLKRKVRQITIDLQRSEQKYRDLIESSPDMIHLISSDGAVKLTNRIALQKLGYNENEIISLKLPDLIIAEQYDEVISFVKTVFRKGFRHKEFVFKSKDGKRIYVEMMATTIAGLNAAEPLACCFSRDMMERKKLEEDLIQSDRLAIMGQMAAGIAHEINNPLGIILSNADDVLHNDLDTETIRQSLESIERNAIRAGKIIEDLLSFTRPNPSEKTPIDLAQLVDETLLFLRHKLRQNKIKIEKFFPCDGLIFHGDENLLQQLLVNLVLNSIQAMPHGGTVRVRAFLQENDGKRKINLEVEDDGIGIPENDLPKIFDPFFTSRKKKGFGLGLFTSKIIARKHHGDLHVRSKLGHGTVMTLELPV